MKVIGGDGGNRTRVRKSIRTGVSERRRLFKIPYIAAKRQAAILGSPKAVTAEGALRRSRSPLNDTLAEPWCSQVG